MRSLDLPRDNTEIEITTLFCDADVRRLTFHRRKLGLRFYAMRIAQQVLKVPYPKPGHDQHVILVTAVERDENQQVVRTIDSGLIACNHI